MQCSKCQFENPDDSNFCLECGHGFEIKCPLCEKVLPMSAKFCNACGHQLTAKPIPSYKDLSFDKKLQKIQRYLPKGLTEKILTQRDRIEGERRLVTVMFCDLEGFTRLTEKLDPEDTYAMMDNVYEILIHKVHDYEGTVNEMTGDGVMALFGAPIALEDAPQRAIRSSLSIHREMAKLSDKMRQQTADTPPLKMRIGVHTGPVVVGTLGNDLRVEFKAVGDTVNLASRMEGLAEPGSTYLTEDTFKLAEGFFRFEALGERKIKGKENTIQIYRAIAPSTRRTRFDVSAERGLTPFIGRERDLELLLDGFERAKEGRGQAFSIVAEAGVGKSRLLYEFRKAVINEDATFLEGKCLSYSKNVAYHPVIDVLKSNFDIKENDSDIEIKQKVIDGLKLLDIDRDSSLPYILELLSIKDSGINEIPMSPEAKKDRIAETVKRITLKGSEIRPLIIATEDLHWSDKSSEEYLKNLLDSIPAVNIFLIFTYRPEFIHTWGAKSYHSQINLNRLSNRESLAMAAHILGSDTIDKGLEELILEKTEGIPFFIEEFVRSLKDLDVIKIDGGGYRITDNLKDVVIPSGIQNVIMARVDKIPEGAKEVLQAGAVIEREFQYELIRSVLEISQEEILSHTSVLKNAELIYERGIFPESTYVFKHSLIREVIYNSILSKKRKQLHEKVGGAIEKIYAENIDEQSGVLAQHFIEAERYQKGAAYCLLTMKKNQRQALWGDAIEYGKKRLKCLEKFPESEANQLEIIEARAKLAGFYTAVSNFAPAIDLISPIIQSAQEMKYQKVLPSIYLTNGLYALYNEEDSETGIKYLNKILEFEGVKRNYFFVWMATYNLGWHHTWNGRFDRGFEYFSKTLENAIKVKDIVGMAWTKGSMSAIYYASMGDLLHSKELSEQAIEIAEKCGDIFAAVTTYISRGQCYYLKGLFSQAEEWLLKGVAICEKTGVFAWWAMGLSFLGDLYTDMEQYEKALAFYKQAIESLTKPGFVPSWGFKYEISAERVKVLSGGPFQDREELFENFQKIKVNFYKGQSARHIAEIIFYSDRSDIEKAEEWVSKAIAIDHENRFKWHLGRDYAFYAHLLTHKGNTSKANENIDKAIAIFKECGAEGWLERCETGSNLES